MKLNNLTRLQVVLACHIGSPFNLDTIEKIAEDIDKNLMMWDNPLFKTIEALCKGGFWIHIEADGEEIGEKLELLNDPAVIFSLSQEVDDFHLFMYAHPEHEVYDDSLGAIYCTNCNEPNESIIDYNCGPQSKEWNTILDRDCPWND